MEPNAEFAAFVNSVEGAIPGGTVPVLAVLVCGAVAAWRQQWLQNLLPEKWQWDNWPRLQKWAVSFALGMGCGFLTNLAAGKSWPVALGLGAGAGFGAMGLRETVKAGLSVAQPRYVDVLPPNNLGPRIGPVD